MCLTVDQDFALDDVFEKCRHCCVVHKRLELSSQFTGQVRDACLTPFKIQSYIILSDQLTHSGLKSAQCVGVRSIYCCTYLIVPTRSALAEDNLLFDAIVLKQSALQKIT